MCMIMSSNSTYKQHLVDEIPDRLDKHLALLYPQNHADVLDKLLAIIAQYPVKHFTDERLWDETDVVLITYGNSLTEPGQRPLHSLCGFIEKYLKSDITGIHILPFFPYSSDDGFSVIDYRQVNPYLGNWQDIKDIAKQAMAELM